MLAEQIGKKGISQFILTAILAGLRAEELRLVDLGGIRTLDDGSAVINLKGEGGKERNVPHRGSPAGEQGGCVKVVEQLLAVSVQIDVSHDVDGVQYGISVQKQSVDGEEEPFVAHSSNH